MLVCHLTTCASAAGSRAGARTNLRFLSGTTGGCRPDGTPRRFGPSAACAGQAPTRVCPHLRLPSQTEVAGRVWQPVARGSSDPIDAGLRVLPEAPHEVRGLRKQPELVGWRICTVVAPDVQHPVFDLGLLTPVEGVGGLMEATRERSEPTFDVAPDGPDIVALEGVRDCKLELAAPRGWRRAVGEQDKGDGVTARESLKLCWLDRLGVPGRRGRTPGRPRRAGVWLTGTRRYQDEPES